MKKFKIATLGCRTNQYESQAFRDQLEKMGYRQALEGESADLCIVNSCTVTEGADSDSRAKIRQLAKQNPDSKLVVTGCLAERDPEGILQIGGVSQVVSNLEKESLISKIFPIEEISEEKYPEFSIEAFKAHTRAFVKVQDGCNSFCTYCVIPYVRGRSRSRDMEDILKEVHTLVKNGYKEVVLTGINIGDFEAGSLRLADLVKEVDAIDGIERIRISSIDPDEVDVALTDAVIKGEKTCPSMHIVLQSGSNVILKRMNRKYTRQVFLETIKKLKSINPDFTFTTDVIVGFPGETDQDFEDTLKMIEEVEFAKVHVFPYSDRPKTRSSTYLNKVPHDVIRKRRLAVEHAAEKASYRLREKYVGKEMLILTENSEGDSTSGHTHNFLEVFIPDVKMSANQIVKVQVMSNSPKGLIGKVVEC